MFEPIINIIETLPYSLWKEQTCKHSFNTLLHYIIYVWQLHSKMQIGGQKIW